MSVVRAGRSVSVDASKVVLSGLYFVGFLAWIPIFVWEHGEFQVLSTTVYGLAPLGPLLHMLISPASASWHDYCRIDVVPSRGWAHE